MVLSCSRPRSLRSKVPIPAKMFPSAFRNYGPGARKDSAIRTLVAETLVLAKTHGCVEKIESELEEELRRESKGQATDPLSKWRRKGDKALKSKYVLLTVALFCVTDCALVLGELILDLHKVKDTLETSERRMHEFKKTLHQTYPNHITDTNMDIKVVFDMIHRSRIIWHDDDDDDGSGGHGHNSTIYRTSNSSNLPPPPPSSRPLSTTSPRHSVVGIVSGAKTRTGTPTVRRAMPGRRRRSAEISAVRSAGTSAGRSGGQEETEYVLVYPRLATRDTSKHSDANNSIVNLVSATSPGEQQHEQHEQQEKHQQQQQRKGQQGADHKHSLEEDIAHVLHLISITLMTILVFETILKAFCAGLPFFKRKLETFDFIIIIVSFIVDIVFMQILPRFEIQDFVFILAFLLPWRVIRVVNSLVVAVQDHEHFRLKMMYSRKKKIQNSLRETEIKLQLFRSQCCALKRLCLHEGVEESKIEEIVQLDEYVVNKTGKSKCKVKIDNASVILLDKCDFPRLSPRPSLASLWEKRRSSHAADGTKEAAGKFAKRNGHTLTVDDALNRDLRKGKGRKSSFSFSNGPFSALFGSRDTEVMQDGIKVRRAGSQGQICEAIKRDFLSVGRKVKRGGSHNQLCHVTVTNELGGVSSPVFQDGVSLLGSVGHLAACRPLPDSTSSLPSQGTDNRAPEVVTSQASVATTVSSCDKWTQMDNQEVGKIAHSHCLKHDLMHQQQQQHSRGVFTAAVGSMVSLCSDHDTDCGSTQQQKQEEQDGIHASGPYSQLTVSTKQQRSASLPNPTATFSLMVPSEDEESMMLPSEDEDSLMTVCGSGLHHDQGPSSVHNIPLASHASRSLYFEGEHHQQDIVQNVPLASAYPADSSLSSHDRPQGSHQNTSPSMRASSFPVEPSLRAVVIGLSDTDYQSMLTSHASSQSVDTPSESVVFLSACDRSPAPSPRTSTAQIARESDKNFSSTPSSTQIDDHGSNTDAMDKEISDIETDTHCDSWKGQGEIQGEQVSVSDTVGRLIDTPQQMGVLGPSENGSEVDARERTLIPAQYVDHDQGGHSLQSPDSVCSVLVSGSPPLSAHTTGASDFPDPATDVTYDSATDIDVKIIGVGVMTSSLPSSSIKKQ